MSASVIIISEREEAPQVHVTQSSPISLNTRVFSYNQSAYKPKNSTFSPFDITFINQSCYVCKSEVNFENEDSFLTEKHVTLHSKQPLIDALGKILNVIINVSSLFVCKKCFSILNKWDEFVSKADSCRVVLKERHFTSVASQSSASKQESLSTKPALADAQKFHQDDYTEHIAATESLSLEDQGITENDPEYVPYNAVHKKQRVKRTKRAALKEGNTNVQKSPEESAVFNGENITDGGGSCESSMNENSAQKESSQICYESHDFDQEKLFCRSCSYLAFDFSDFETHKKTHFCKKCFLYLTEPGMMRHHRSSVHGTKKKPNKFSCSVCDKKYASQGSLSNHVEAAHKNQISTCDICNSKFKQKRLLEIHKLRHGEKSFKCAECHASFFLRTQLNKHTNQVHRMIRPYECKKCHKFFSQRCVLTHHLSQHIESDRNISGNPPIGLPDSSADVPPSLLPSIISESIGTQNIIVSEENSSIILEPNFASFTSLISPGLPEVSPGLPEISPGLPESFLLIDSEM